MLAVYLTCVLFVVVVLGAVMRYCRVPLWGFHKYIKSELLRKVRWTWSRCGAPLPPRPKGANWCRRPRPNR